MKKRIHGFVVDMRGKNAPNLYRGRISKRYFTLQSKQGGVERSTIIRISHCTTIALRLFKVVYDRKLFRCFFGRTVRPKVLPKLFGQKFEIFNRTEPSAEPASFCRTSQFRPKRCNFGRNVAGSAKNLNSFSTISHI